MGDHAGGGGCTVSKAADFKRELRALLEKYGASIGVGYADCSDTHGMYDEHMTVDFDDRTSVTVCHGWGIDASDLKEDGE